MREEWGRWNNLRNRAEVAVYRELRPMVRGGVVRVRVALAGAILLACVLGSGGYVLGSADGPERAATAYSDGRVTADRGASRGYTREEDQRATTLKYERLAKKYAGNPPNFCGTERIPRDLSLRSMCD